MTLLDWLKRRRPAQLDDADFDAELQSHFAIAEADKIADGADRETAHYASLKEFGNVTRTTEDAREVWTPAWLEALRDFLSDVRYAIRTLVKNPAFAVTVAGVLTLGIGVNAAVFTMLKGMAFSPLSGVAASSQLVDLFAASQSGRALRLSYPEYQYLRDHDQAFASLFSSVFTNVGLGRGQASRSITAELVSGNYFEALRVGAQRGRTLQQSDEIAPGRHPVVVISDTFWRLDFGADPAIVGKTIELNHYPLTVVGVADARYHGTIVSYDVDVFIPLLMAADLGYNFGSQERSATGIFADRRAAMLIPQGFLRPGVSLASAQAQTAALWPALARERPLNDPAQQLTLVRFWQSPGSAQTYLLPILTVIAVMGVLVLLIACANIAGLVLVRGVSRRGEIAVRLALGATRLRIIRLLVIENLIVALPGTVLGVLAAIRATGALVEWADRFAAPQPLYFNFNVDALVIAFAAVVAVLCALVFGFAPALKSSRLNLVEVMNEASRRTAGGRFRGSLVVAQVAVSLLLLIGASLVSRSFEAALRANPGFEPAHMTVTSVDLKQNGYDAARGQVFYQRLLDAARSDASVESATLASYIPMNLLDTPSSRVSVDGYEPHRGEDLAFLTNTIAPDYFKTLRIPLLAGREFQDDDRTPAAPVAIVNATLATRFWAGAENAIGKRVRVADGDWRTIVGVAADVKYLQVNEAPRPYIYLPFLQSYRPAMMLHTRGAAPDDVLVKQARAAIVSLDGDLPILFADPMVERVKGPTFFYRFAAFMLFIFGATGMALAALGAYGLVSYAVTQSTREIGIRMAVGATGGSVLRRFLGRGVRLGAIGAIAGTLGALAASRLLSTVLFEVSATDPLSFLGAIGLVIMAIVVATAVPAWRAARTNPLTALHHE